MAKDTLYVANLPPDVDEIRLRELFGQFGEVTSAQIAMEEKSKEPYALVQMAAEKMATIANNTLNGQKIGERFLAISYPDFDPSRELMSKQRKTVEAIVEELGETHKVPIREIEMMARQCGIGFLQSILADTLEVEARGGMWYGDNPPARRSKGGVFFYLARFRMSPEIRHVVFNRKGKPPAPQDEQPSTEGNQAVQAS